MGNFAGDLDVSVTQASGVQLEKSLNIVQRSMNVALGTRLLSFKGIVTPGIDYKSRTLLPLVLVTIAQAAAFLWHNELLLAPLVANVNLYISYFNLYRFDGLFVYFETRTAVMLLLLLGTLVVAWVLSSRSPPMYLVDYACFKPSEECKMTSERFLELAEKSKYFTETSLDFQRKILTSSGLGPETYIPLSMHQEPTDFTLPTSMKEAETALFSAVAELLKKTGVKTSEIGILVVNCSTFCPIPSLSAMVVNHFGLREDIETYNLGGMGCSAGVLAINLAQDLLKVHKNTYAIALSTEMISGRQVYTGNDRSMMVGNCIFRWGASAILLSNKHKDRGRAKYSLLHVVRTHQGANPRSFECVKTFLDAAGFEGVSLSKTLMAAAGDALKSNITTLAPKILPISEKLKYATNLMSRKLLKAHKPYTPNFQSSIDHFCIHPGGKAVLDGIEKNLRLSSHHMEPSRMSLHRFGNQSSSSIWYVLAYMEAKHRVRRGDLVWQIALGSGIKCNSAVWKSLRSDHIDESRCENPWLDCVDRYPVHLHGSAPTPALKP
ncbi:hypothetical protein M758_10G155500 [Ceratodon purpureus]|nr:hypothetical protein M758_10G155500 [Ceratodon purpureus]